MAFEFTPAPTLPALGSPSTFNNRALALFDWIANTHVDELEAMFAGNLLTSLNVSLVPGRYYFIGSSVTGGPDGASFYYVCDVYTFPGNGVTVIAHRATTTASAQRSFIGTRTASTGALTWAVLSQPAGTVYASVTIADDAVGTVTMPRFGSFVSVIPGGDITSVQNAGAGLFLCDVGSSELLISVYSGVDFAISTSTLTGTTGTDGDVTVKANNDKTISIENRRGQSFNFHVGVL